jgi:hypothetical protein
VVSNVSETIGTLGSPGGVHAIHFADDAFRREAMDNGDIVSHSSCPGILQDRKLGFTFRCQAAAQQALAYLQQVEERAFTPLVAFMRLFAIGRDVI